VRRVLAIAAGLAILVGATASSCPPREPCKVGETYSTDGESYWVCVENGQPGNEGTWKKFESPKGRSNGNE
jgi:hypothetical protein